jgi:hypothetical protein
MSTTEKGYPEATAVAPAWESPASIRLRTSRLPMRAIRMWRFNQSEKRSKTAPVGISALRGEEVPLLPLEGASG